ncbi:MAG TPA: AsnC family transcriptional regulator [Candidatus Bathyarchaeia archaeon]|nr:AsnC family transcriptional regulator [Candidatus Bathyarchaeia archaeon]
MKRPKDTDRRIISELIKNAKLSDRQISRKLGVSQPTVTRRRTLLEKQLIEGYTLVPKWDKFGYEIFAITLVKSKPSLSTKEQYEAVRKRGTEWLMKQPNVIMGGGCRGAGANSFMISLHKNYSEYDEFMYQYRREWGDAIDDVQPILVNLVGRELLKPLNLKYLAETT